VPSPAHPLYCCQYSRTTLPSAAHNGDLRCTTCVRNPGSYPQPSATWDECGTASGGGGAPTGSCCATFYSSLDRECNFLREDGVGECCPPGTSADPLTRSLCRALNELQTEPAVLQVPIGSCASGRQPLCKNDYDMESMQPVPFYMCTCAGGGAVQLGAGLQLRSFTDGNPSTTAVLLCPEGNTCADGVAKPCAPGEHCPIGCISAEECPADWWCPGGGQASRLCPPGKLCAAGLATACPRGKVCPEGSSTPKDCPGYGFVVCAREALAKADPCPDGRDCSSVAQLMPSNPERFTDEQLMDLVAPLCPEGYYCNAQERKVQCQKNQLCPAGTAHPFVCPAGSYCPNTTGAAVVDPVPCPIGFVCPGGPAPELCPFFRLCVKPSLSEPELCPMGRDCEQRWIPPPNAASMSDEERVESAAPLCEVGYFCNGYRKKECPVGHECPVGSWEGTLCPLGFVAPTPASGACDACPAGRYADVQDELPYHDSRGRTIEPDPRVYCSGSCGASGEEWMYRAGESKCVRSAAFVGMLVAIGVGVPLLIAAAAVLLWRRAKQQSAAAAGLATKPAQQQQSDARAAASGGAQVPPVEKRAAWHRGSVVVQRATATRRRRRCACCECCCCCCCWCSRSHFQ